MKKITAFVIAIFLGTSFFLPLSANGALPQCSGRPLAGTISDPINSAGECSTKCSSQSGYAFKEYSDAGFEGLDPTKKFTCCCQRSSSSVFCPAGKICLGNPLNTSDIPALIGGVLRMLFGLIGTIALVIFIYGGALWMTAFGEESKVKRGWDTMIWGAIGLVVIFGSYVAVDFILKAILGS